MIVGSASGDVAGPRSCSRMESAVAHAVSLPTIDLIAGHELADRGIAHVVMMEAAEQVVEHAEAQRPVGVGHVLEIEFLEDRAHDRDAAGQDRQPVGAHAGEIEGIDVAGLDQGRLQTLEADAVRPATGRPD